MGTTSNRQSGTLPRQYDSIVIRKTLRPARSTKEEVQGLRSECNVLAFNAPAHTPKCAMRLRKTRRSRSQCTLSFSALNISNTLLVHLAIAQKQRRLSSPLLSHSSIVLSRYNHRKNKTQRRWSHTIPSRKHWLALRRARDGTIAVRSSSSVETLITKRPPTVAKHVMEFNGAMLAVIVLHWRTFKG